MQLKNKVKKGFFIVGTDTGVGKTVFASMLLKKLSAQGKKTLGIKPVASGCFIKDGKLYNEDALSLYKYSSYKLPYELINPFAFYEPISPHLAAEKSNVELSVATVIEKSKPALTADVDYVVIESAGGWFTPINDKETMADLAKAYGYPIILVVGIRLGCINQALLTYEAVKKSGLPIVGWVANVIDKDVLYPKENIESIKERLINIPNLY